MVVGKEMPEFFKIFKECFENRMLMNLKAPVDNRLGFLLTWVAGIFQNFEEHFGDRMLMNLKGPVDG
jgi:hypothetical protein